MRADVFEQVRHAVSAQQAAQRYGLEVRRGKALCPFHPDHRPSMSFRGARFKCWSCGASGDAVDLTAHLLGLAPLEALDRLNRDFGLGLSLDRPATPEARQKARAAARRRQEVAAAHADFEAWRAKTIRRLSDAFCRGHVLLRDGFDLDGLTDGEAAAVRLHSTFDFWLDLLSGDPAEQAAAWQGREGIDKWTEQALRP